jgi:hypothetical protein
MGYKQGKDAHNHTIIWPTTTNFNQQQVWYKFFSGEKVERQREIGIEEE